MNRAPPSALTLGVDELHNQVQGFLDGFAGVERAGQVTTHF